jgi:NADH:ubiquinone oxidoreductase subunit D
VSQPIFILLLDGDIVMNASSHVGLHHLLNPTHL